MDDPRARAQAFQGTIGQLIGVAKAQVVASAAGDTEKHEKLCAQETGLLDRMDKLLNDPDLPESERKEWIKEMDRKLSPWME